MVGWNPNWDGEEDFNDGFDTDFDSKTGTGLSVIPDAALEGAEGGRVTTSDTEERYWLFDAEGQTEVTVDFMFDPTGLSVGAGQGFFIVRLQKTGGTESQFVYIYHETTPGITGWWIKLVQTDDSEVADWGPPFPLIQGTNQCRVIWKRSSGAGRVSCRYPVGRGLPRYP